MEAVNSPENKPDDGACQLKAKPAILTATIEIKRAATGKVETYQIVGTVPAEDQKEP